MLDSKEKKPLFKKKKRKGANVRKHKADDDEEDTSPAEAIRATQKRRQLIRSTVYKRGIDAASTLQATKEIVPSSAVESAEDVQPSNDNLASRLKGTFSGGTGRATSSDGVLQRKHMDAMEDYIRQNMSQEDGNSAKSTTAATTAASSSSSSKDLKSKLFEELAETAQQISRLGDVGTSIGDDVGDGGEVLGGTGIAEVILPEKERLENARATEAAAMASTKRRMNASPTASASAGAAETRIEDLAHSSLPTNFTVGRGKRKRKDQDSRGSSFPKSRNLASSQAPRAADLMEASASSAGFQVLDSDVSNVASSFSQNFRQHAQDKKARQRAAASQEGTGGSGSKSNAGGDNAASSSSTSHVDNDRMGFEAARRVARGEPASLSSTKPRQNQRASDDRVWKQFVRNERDRMR